MTPGRAGGFRHAGSGLGVATGLWEKRSQNPLALHTALATVFMTLFAAAMALIGAAAASHRYYRRGSFPVFALAPPDLHRSRTSSLPSWPSAKGQE